MISVVPKCAYFCNFGTTFCLFYYFCENANILWIRLLEENLNSDC